MKQWFKSSVRGNKWLSIIAISSSSGVIGYLASQWQTHKGIPSFGGLSHQSTELLSSVAAPRDGPVFPSALFSSVSAATKMQDSLILRTEDAVPEPSPNAPRIAQIMRFGFPSLSNVRSLDDYVLSYDTRTRVPHWVFEHLTARSIAKNEAVDRAKCDFREDGSIHEYFRSTNKDYKHSGFDRGHMAAAGNHRLSQETCQETFLLTNMAPQVGRGFNRDKWNDLEQYCRSLARNNRNVYVCTGPLFLPRQEEDGHLYVRYRVLGNNHVAVPTHFFKVVVCETESGDLHQEAYLLPNAVIDDKTPLSTFHVPTEVIERASGLLLFDRITAKKFKKINGKSSWF